MRLWQRRSDNISKTDTKSNKMYFSDWIQTWKMCLILFGMITLSGLVVAETDSVEKPPIWLVPSLDVIERQVADAMLVTCFTNQGHSTTWLNPHKMQIVSKKGRMHVESTQSKGHSLVFEDIRNEDKGNYTCKAMVDGKEIKTHFKLDVIVPTTFNNTPAVQESELGQNMTVHCYAQGNPKPSVMWHFNGKTIEDNSKYQVLKNGLLIRNVTVRDSGVYECRTYQMSPFTSTIKDFKITVRIQHKPTFQTKEGYTDLVHGYISGTVNLTCHALAEPKPRFEWIKDNKPVVETEHIAIYNEDHASTLELELNNMSMFGDYDCKAINKLGTTEKVLVLKEGDRPEPPTSVSDLHATSDAIQMKVVPPTGGILPVTGFRVQYVTKHSNNANWAEEKHMDFHIAEDGVYYLQNLSQDTEYVLRVQTRNAAGFSVSTEEKIIRTHKIQADSVAKSSAILSKLPFSILGLVINIISVRYLLLAEQC